ncbi:alpha/beta hydrolase [Leifsonia sp. NPDC058292]|uniref:alpha/beta hydrolase n=1 Tax=Leifsonia sp. NPDC058292 TaxID=3346428 RepID=UPI0036DBB49A
MTAMTATAAEPSWHRKPASRGARIARAIVAWVAAALVLVIVGFLVWANTYMEAERAPLDSVWADPAVSISDRGDSVVLAPTGEASGVGLVFVPGARVDAYAYLYKLSGVVAAAGVTVVVTKPILNLAFFDQRPLSTFTSQAPAVTDWYVGGHSLGGVRACQYATDPAVKGLVLLGSYCANDLSTTDLAVISLSGSEDGLSTPQKVSDARHLLPADATMTEIAGANHARFGDYGPQPGDGTATIGTSRMRDEVTAGLSGFWGGDD